MKYFQVNYDIIPCQGVITEATAFNVANLTGIWELSGHTAFTSHFQILNTNLPQLTVASANFRTCITSNCSVQLVQMYYNNNIQVWENIGSLLTCRPGFTVDNLSDNITTAWNSWSGTPFQRNLSIKVKGNGKVYEARLEVVYQVTDSGVDYSSELTDLSNRITALENAGPIMTGPLSTEQVDQVITEARERLIS